MFVTALQKTMHLDISAATRAEIWLAAFNAKAIAGAQRHHHKVDPKARLSLVMADDEAWITSGGTSIVLSPTALEQGAGAAAATPLSDG